VPVVTFSQLTPDVYWVRIKLRALNSRLILSLPRAEVLWM